MKASPTYPGSTRRGFSLIELLVAMAITSILMITLFSLVGQSTTSYTQTSRAVNAVSQARAFIQFFDRELSTRLPGTQLIHETGSYANPAESDRIAFIRTLISDEQTAYEKQTPPDPGDLGAIIYYVGFSSDGGGAVSPKLFRKSLGPKDTQTLIESGATAALPAVDPNTDEPIVPNIISFKAIPQFRSIANGAWENWIATSSIQPPSRIELTITFIDESSAQRFKTTSEWNRLATAPRDSELQLSRTFTRNIAIAK